MVEISSRGRKAKLPVRSHFLTQYPIVARMSHEEMLFKIKVALTTLAPRLGS